MRSPIVPVPPKHPATGSKNPWTAEARCRFPPVSPLAPQRGKATTSLTPFCTPTLRRLPHLSPIPKTLFPTFNLFATLLFVRHPKNRISQPMPEGLVILELLKELGVVFEERGNDSSERFVVLDLGILPI